MTGLSWLYHSLLPGKVLFFSFLHLSLKFYKCQMSKQPTSFLSSTIFFFSFLVWWLENMNYDYVKRRLSSFLFSLQNTWDMKHLQQLLHCIALFVVKIFFCGDTIHFRELISCTIITDSLQAISMNSKDVSWAVDNWKEERIYRFIPSCKVT